MQRGNLMSASFSCIANSVLKLLLGENAGVFFYKSCVVCIILHLFICTVKFFLNLETSFPVTIIAYYFSFLTSYHLITQILDMFSKLLFPSLKISISFYFLVPCNDNLPILNSAYFVHLLCSVFFFKLKSQSFTSRKHILLLNILKWSSCFLVFFCGLTPSVPGLSPFFISII